MTSSEVFEKRETFYGTKNERSKAGHLIWLVTWICYRGRTKAASERFFYPIKIGRRGEQISATQTCHKGGIGAPPSAAGRFFGKKWLF